MKTKICLSMIVKNESACIQRSLQAIKPLISYWIISDTGSTDNTEEVVKQTLAGVPGEFHHHTWEDFSTNRNLALELAKKHGDYILIMDADDILEVNRPEVFRNLTHEAYYISIIQNDITYQRVLLFKSTLKAQYVGVLHEYLELPAVTEIPILADCKVLYTGAGSRSTDANKYHRDAKVLENALQKDPGNARNRFYLAQSYRDAGELELSFQNYLIRAAMTNGWIEETFYAQYMAGSLAILLNKPHALILEILLKAYEIRPTRAESLHELAVYCRNQKLFAQAYLFAKVGSQIPYPPDNLFVKKDIYQWKLLDELAVAAYWVGKYEESKQACEEIIKNQHSMAISADTIARVKANWNYANNNIKKTG